MGSSFTEYNKNGFWARDGQVEVWLYLLVQEIEKLESPPEWLIQAKQDWHLQATVGFTGCVSPSLDEIVTSEERKELVIRLCQSVLAKLKEIGPKLTVVAEYSYRTEGPENLCNNVDKRIHEYYGQHFLNLLLGKISTNASTSKVAWPPEVPY